MSGKGNHPTHPQTKKKKKLRGIIIIPLTLKNYIYERILGIILEHMDYL